MAPKRRHNSYYILATLLMSVVAVYVLIWSSRQTPAAASRKDLSKNAATHKDLSQNAASHKDLSQNTATHKDLSKKAATHKDLSQNAATHKDLSQNAATHKDLSQNAATHKDLSQNVVTLKRDSANRSFLTHGNLELPSCTPNDSMTYNKSGRYTLQYSPSQRSAIWVAYKLTLADTNGKAGRSNGFYTDAVLKNRGFVVAVNEDYKNSGYDKGHLLPSADRQSSKEENRATFVLSNCSPQLPKLNRGTWKSLEEYTRDLCQNYDTLYIVTGIIPDNPIGKLGRAKVSIPRGYYKVILARRGDTFTSFAYVMPNSQNIDSKRERYGVSLSQVEQMTSMVFFPQVTFRN